jgi:S-adenosylmethionine synthetase
VSSKFFTSESVCAGHPDKICDAISDAILDEALSQDRDTRAGIETVVGANQISLFGELKTTAKLNYEEIARTKIAELGYTNKDWGFSEISKFSNFLHEQSPEIAIGVDNNGAGDQGMMFGFACNETEHFMPLPVSIAHALTNMLDTLRENYQLAWVRPDGKAQVTIEYKDGKPIAIKKIVMAICHNESINPANVRKLTIEHVIEPVVKNFGYKVPKQNDIIINGTGVWHIPGPDSDAGLTGRKIVVDTYGGYARVGGGAFSGKDASKVDRSGAYAARYIAKNVVASGLAQKCEVGLAYVIGKPKPLMKTIDCFSTNSKTLKEIESYADGLIDTSVAGIIEKLKLKEPVFSKTSAYGHFGKPDLTWEKIV